MRLAAASLGALALALAACASTAPGTGWTRASDLSVYASMHVFARAALDQEDYCLGRDPDRTRADWAREFEARQAAVSLALASRYGREAMRRARATYAPRVACGDVPDPQWHTRYARLLRLLEIRLHLARREG